MVAVQQEKLLEKLNLDGLSNWTPRNVAAARGLILTFHDIFTLDGNKLGCMSVIEHKIGINNSEPFKEWFRCISLPLLDEVCALLRDMLDAGAICPSQSPWCKAVVLVWKKDAWMSAGLMCIPRRTCTHCHRYKKHWRVWWALHTFQQWTLRADLGKSGWHPSPNSILPSWWEIWDSMSLLTCPLGYAMPQ